MKNQWIFKGKVKDNNPMTNPADGWVEGFYYEDLCLDEDHNPVMKSFIRSGEMIWEVIPESVHIQTPVKDNDGNIIFDGDILNVMCNDGSHANCLMGFDEKRVGWGLMESHYFTGWKEGYFDESYNNTFLTNCLTHDTVIRILGNIYDNEKLLIS